MVDITVPDEPPMQHAVRGLVIVARGQPELWQALKREIGDTGKVSVLLDRRQTERRQGVQPITVDGRRTERRHPPGIEEDLRLRHYVLIRPDSRRPHD
jgi:hypothetical protein